MHILYAQQKAMSVPLASALDIEVVGTEINTAAPEEQHSTGEK